MQLKQLLDDVSHLIAPRGHGLEVLVVDNNSSDGTKQLLAGRVACGPHPLRVVCETAQGLSHARNRGIREARGEWTAFTDDDVRLPAEWLANLVGEVEASGALAGGGRVTAKWPTRTPSWIARSGPFAQAGAFVCYVPSPISRWLQPDDPQPVGCNLLIRTDLFEAHGGFRTDLGRTGNTLISGEDTEFYNRLRAAEVGIWFALSAEVVHPVEPHRLRLGYLWSWRFGSGVTLGRMVGTGHRRLLGVPTYLLRGVVVASLRCFRLPVHGSPDAVARLAQVCETLGAVWGAWASHAVRPPLSGPFREKSAAIAPMTKQLSRSTHGQTNSDGPSRAPEEER